MTRKKKSRKAGPLGLKKEERARRPSRNLEQLFSKKLKGNKPGSRHNPEDVKKAEKTSSPENTDKRHGSKKPIALDSAPVQPVQQEPVFKRDMQPSAKLVKEKPKVSPEQELNALETEERFLSLIELVEEGKELESKDAKYFNKCVKRHQELTKILGIDDEDPSDEDLLNEFESDDWKDDFID